MWEVTARFILGGLTVSLFAALGEVVQPKTFAGIFSAAPSVALVALAMAFTAREWLLRFVFGGIVTVGTGMMAHGYGPATGGLFLAFPAILPASLTLVTSHEGRKPAQQEARGARVGAWGLIAFAAVTAALAPHHGVPLTMTAATLAVGLWCVTS